MNSTAATLKPLRPLRTKATCASGHTAWTRSPPGSVIVCWRCKKDGRTTKVTVPGKPPPPPPPLPHPGRLAWLAERLMDADGPSYDDLCAAVVAAFGGDGLKKDRWRASRDGVREVRLLLWDGLATTEPSDGSVWLTRRAGGCSTR